MKALTISQPFASLIADGVKWVENRRWFTEYRGPLAIHAGKGTQYLDRKELAGYPTGCIVAVARLVLCLNIERLPYSRRQVVVIGSKRSVGEILDHDHTEGPWCWVLEDVVKLDSPVPYRGAQGLFEVPDDLFPSRPQLATRNHPE